MTSTESEWAALVRFLDASAFRERGAVITDLDGTAVHELDGRATISPSIEAGLAAIHEVGRQVLINTLRFPLSVIRVFGAEWTRITGAAIPLVSLNGSQVGIISGTADGNLGFQEIDAFPLQATEIDDVLHEIGEILRHGGDHLLVFIYGRDWQRGEEIWTPRADRIAAVSEKYRSASRVFSGSAGALAIELHARQMCMLFLLVDAPEDRLMAYQHTQTSRFVTHRGVDKRHGAMALADRLGLSLPDSIGAGDAPPDNFLQAVGFAVAVGRPGLEYRGLVDTLHVDHPETFGHMLLAVAETLRPSQS